MTGHTKFMGKPNVKELLLENGLRILQAGGFNATSVQDITEAAGVPKGSFYNHFDSKEALGADAVVRYMENAGAFEVVLHDKSLAPLVRLRRYFEGLIEERTANDFRGGCLLVSFGAELSDHSELIRTTVSQGFQTWTSTIGSVIAEAQEAGDVAGDISVQLLTDFLLNSWEGCLLRAKIEKSHAPLEQFMQLGFTKILSR